MSDSNWEKIKKCRVSDVDSENVNDIIELLNKIDMKKCDDKKQIDHVLQLASSVINIRSQQWKSAEEVILEKENEILSLNDENDELEKENRELQKAITSSGANQEMIKEKRKLSDEVKSFGEETRGLRQKLEYVNREKDTLAAEKGELKRKIEALQEEIQTLTERCEFLQSRFQEKPLSKEPGEIKFRKELSNLRSQIRVQKAKIDTLEDEKQALWTDIQKLEHNLKQATAELDRAADEHQRMKEALSEADRSLSQKTAECDVLRSQIAQFSRRTEEPDSSSDIIMEAVDTKVTEWKQALLAKDSEIVELYDEIKKLRQEVTLNSLDRERNTAEILSKTLRERDEQVRLLKDQLSEATQEVERSAKLLEELKADLAGNGESTGDQRVEQIRKLQGQLQAKNNLITDLERKARVAEQSLQTQAAELCCLETQVKRLQSGEYGLADAINELKTVRAQLDSKERQMEELCRIASQAESAMNETNIENEHLRTRLGIALDEPIDLNGYKQKKRVKEEEERAVNEVLQKEIEKLEDERLELKRRLRAAARQLGQKAASENDHVESALFDVLGDGAVDEAVAMTNVSNIHAAPPSRRQLSSEDKEEFHPALYQSRIEILNAELGKATESIEAERKAQDELKVRLAQVTEANACLEKGLRELQAQIKSGQVQMVSDPQTSNTSQSSKLTIDKMDGQLVVDCPSLDKLLAALDARSLGEDLDTGRFLKARVDHLEGANCELRRELREVRLCAAEKDIQLRQVEERNKTLDSQIRALQSISGPLMLGEQQSTKNLSPDLDSDTAQIIQHLEEHLQTVLSELDDKVKQLNALDREVEEYRRKFAMCRHRQGLLYQDFHAEREEWKQERKKLEEKIAQAEAHSREADVYKAEMAHLTETLARVDECNTSANLEEIKGKLADLVRQITVLRVNEAGLVRRFRAAQEREEMLRKENTSLKSELIQMESAVTARLGFYTRYREKAAFQLANLQQALDQSVARVDHERLMRDYEQMAGKYRELLDRRTSNSVVSVTLNSTETELRKLREQHEALKTQLEVEKERRCLLELKVHPAIDKGLKDESSILAQRVALLEMKELNERERANHAQYMLDTIKGSIQQLEARNSELEATVSKLTKAALDLQIVEQELRQELADAIPRDTYIKIENQLKSAESDNLNLRHEIEQLKEIALISVSQNEKLQDQQTGREIEADSLRQQLIALEAMDDDREALAKLHRQLTRLQISEATAVRRLAASQERATRLENAVLKLEQRLSAVEDERLGQRCRLREREKRFRDTVNLLRIRFAGCVPLMEQERTIHRLNELTQERASLQSQLNEALDVKIACEAKLDSLKERVGLSDEVRGVLHELQVASGKRPGNRNEILDRKFVEWQTRLADLRLSESTQRRQAEKLRQQVHHLELLLQSQEAQLNNLELDNARLSKELDQRELQWEQREAELEEALTSMESGQNEVVRAACNIQSAQYAFDCKSKQNSDQLPDPNLPIHEQLSEALAILKRYTLQLFDQKVENEGLKKRVAELSRAIRERERQALVCEENRPTHENTLDVSASNPVIASLRMNVELLERRLAAKEESLRKANELLKEANRANEEAHQRHTNELVALQSKLHGKMEEALLQLTKAVESTGDRSRQADNQTENLIKRLRELEDALSEQNQVMIKQIEQSRQLQRDCDLWKLRYEQFQAQAASDKETMENTYRQKLTELRKECDRLQTDLQDRSEQISQLTEEARRWRLEATKSPSVMQRQLTDRLRTDLAEKEKQNQALSKALADLRREFVAQAEQSVLASATNPVSLAPVKEQTFNRKVVSKQSSAVPSAKTVMLAKEKQIDAAATTPVFTTSPVRMNQLEKENKQLSEECKLLRGQLERIKQTRKLTEENALRRQVEELTCKTRSLEEENNRLRMVPEKPYQDTIRALKETAQSARGNTPPDWESRKRLEAELAKLRTQTVKQSSDLVYQQKQLELTKSALERATRENEVLRERVKSRWGPGALPGDHTDVILPQQNHPVEVAERVTLHKQVEDLKAEVQRLRRAERITAELPPGTKTISDQTMAIEASEIRNRIATDRIRVLEQQLMAKGLTTQNKLQIERTLQDDLLRLNTENLELRFELETARADIPRLKTRIYDLQTYVDVLKEEKEALRAGRPMDKNHGSEINSMTTIKRIGESGKSAKELEQIIVRLKRVLQRTQAENERLKCAPGPVSQEQTKRMQAEIEQLRADLERAQMAAGARLNADRLKTEKSITRLSQEYEHLRKSYEEVVNEHDKTKAELRQTRDSGI